MARWHARQMTITYVPSEILLKVKFYWLKPKKRRKILSARMSILVV